MQTFIMRAAAVLLCAAVFILLPLKAAAQDGYDYGREALEDAVPPEAAAVLDGKGIDPDSSGAEDLSFGGAVAYLWELVCERTAAPLRLLLSLCGVILLCAVTGAAADNGQDSTTKLFSAVGVLAGSGMTAAALSDILTEALELLSAASVFITTFIPIFAGILSVMGRTASASAVNAVTLAATQLFSQLAVNLLAPLCGTIMGLAITGAIHPQLDTAKLGESIRKAVVWALGLLMTLFMSILSVQTVVTGSADSMLIRTAKFAVSSGVPLIGGTISDAVATVHGGLALIKSSVGTFGIIAAAVMILPTLVSVTCYRLAIGAAEAVSDIFGTKELSALLKSGGAVVSIISAVIACFLLLNTIAAVIMLAMGSGIA